MPRVRDVLHRFRPSGAPGAATAAGVPADRAAELAAELEPVLALLAETDRECADLLEGARLEEAEIRARHADRARSVLATGRALVEAERAAATASTRGRDDDLAGAVPARGPDGPGGRARLGDPFTPHVDLVVDAVRSLLGRGTGSEDPLAGAR